MAAKTGRQSWLDTTSDAPLIHEQTAKLSTFVDAMADGFIDTAELSAQEARLQQELKSLEPKLDDALHADVTRLLCELTAYNIMKTLASLQDSRPKSVFRG
jgi:1,6-anhydro-N-acetylmuramate kinase